jgi:RNA polymerase sigma-70 factor (ECF subfamily)
VPDFDSIYDQHFRFVWNSARRLGVRTEAIDDVVQEVFVVIHAKLHTVHSPESLRSWIYGVVRRTVSNHFRELQRREGTQPFPEQPALASLEPTPLDLAEQASQVELLTSLLARLTDAKREVFILSELEELSMPEIAAALDIPLNTAYSRLRHARKEFEAALDFTLAATKKRGLG